MFLPTKYVLQKALRPHPDQVDRTALPGSPVSLVATEAQEQFRFLLEAEDWQHPLYPYVHTWDPKCCPAPARSAIASDSRQSSTVSSPAPVIFRSAPLAPSFSLLIW